MAGSFSSARAACLSTADSAGGRAPVRPRAREAGPRPLSDDRPLKFRQRPEEMKHQCTARGACVDGFRQRAQPNMTAVQGFDRVEELPERPGQAVELPDHQRIVGTHAVERGVQLRTVALGATGFFGKDGDRLRPQLIELTIFALPLLGPSGGVATNLSWASSPRAERKDSALGACPREKRGNSRTSA